MLFSQKRAKKSDPFAALQTLLVGRQVGMMHIVCNLQQGSDVFETYWTARHGVDAMDNSYRAKTRLTLWQERHILGLDSVSQGQGAAPPVLSALE